MAASLGRGRRSRDHPAGGSRGPHPHPREPLTQAWGVGWPGPLTTLFGSVQKGRHKKMFIPFTF